MRNVLIRKQYRPPELSAEQGGEEWIHETQKGTLTADELLRHYAKHVYAMAGNYQETARRLQLDRRTVKSKVEEENR